MCRGLLSVVILLFLSSCCTSKTVLNHLEDIDSLLVQNPSQALDSLARFNIKDLSQQERALYGLLVTIATHKTGGSFKNDSLISESSSWFTKHDKNSHDAARAFFYHGLVLDKIAPRGDTFSFHYYKKAQKLLQGPVQDDKLLGLLFTYLGKKFDRENTLDLAAGCFTSAIQREKKNGNHRNMFLDYCLLINCLIKADSISLAKQQFAQFEQLLQQHPDIRLENINNTKAIYYLYCDDNLDSSLFYCRKWQPAPSDVSAKEQMLADIFKKKEQWDSSLLYQRSVLLHRRPSDSLSYHVIYKELSDRYASVGNSDSSAYYTNLAYLSLNETLDKKIDKRILELDKKYDKALEEEKLLRTIRERDTALLLLALASIALALAGFMFILSRKNRALSHKMDLRSKVVNAVVKSVAATYNGINKRLTIIHNLPDNRRQDEINRLITDNKCNIASNLEKALADLYSELPDTIQMVVMLLSGTQQKSVFILSELGCSNREIEQLLGIPGNAVRSVKVSIRKKIEAEGLTQLKEIRSLEIMSPGKRGENSNNRL